MRRLLYTLLILALLVQPGASAWLIRPASAPAPADFPVVAATQTSNDSDGADPRPIAFGETPPDGDLLLVLVSGDSGNGAWGWPAGWTELFDDAGALNQPRCAAAYKVASGESTSIDATYGAAFNTSHQYYRLTGFDSATAPEASAMVEGTSTTPDPGALTPSWGAANTLWLAFTCADNNPNTLVSAPTNYGTVVSDATAGISNNTHSARRELNATTEDPGVFTLNLSEQWHAYTLAIRPGAEGDDDLLTDDFEAADGTELVTHGWTDENTCPTDACEIDTAQFQAGASSGLLNHSVDASIYRLFQTIPEQASGTFTVDWWHRFDTLPSGGNEQFMAVTDGVYAFDTTTLIILRRQNTNSVGVRSSAPGYDQICTGCLTEDVWHHFEIEVDATAETYTVWHTPEGGSTTQLVLDKAFAVSGAADRIYLQKRASTDSSAAAWVDELRVYTGERTP